MWDALRFEHWSLNCEYWFPRWVTHAPNSVGAQTPNPKFVPKAPSPTGPTTQNKWAKEEVCWQAALNDNVLIFYEKRGISPSDNSGFIFFSTVELHSFFLPVFHWDSNWHCFFGKQVCSGRLWIFKWGRTVQKDTKAPTAIGQDRKKQVLQ